MQEVQEKISVNDQGLRERKRLETHARIQAEGLRLFLDRGFEATTLDEVAQAADVSRRTLLNYFGSKEEIVFSAKAGFPQMVADAIAARPAEEPLLDMVENAFLDLARQPRSEETKAVAILIHGTPSLRAGDQAKYEQVERLLAEALAARKGLAAARLIREDARHAASSAEGRLRASRTFQLECRRLRKRRCRGCCAGGSRTGATKGS
jgi:AcrR family transcriptional regulator